VSSNDFKTPLAPALNRLAQQRADDAIQLQGKALPCTVVSRQGQLVTVSFDVTGPFTIPNVTMPIATSQYDWSPIQVGDRGVAQPSSVYLGGVSGQGGGTANFSQPANLSALTFTPVADATWLPPGGNDAFRIVQGPGGAIVQDSSGAALVKVTPTQVTVTVPVGAKIILSSGGAVQAVKLADGSNSMVVEAA